MPSGGPATLPFSLPPAYKQQEQQRVAVRPGNAHCTSIRQVLHQHGATASMLLLLCIGYLMIKN